MNTLIKILEHRAEEYWMEALLSLVYTIGVAATVVIFWWALYSEGVSLPGWEKRDFLMFALVADLSVQIGAIIYPAAPNARMIRDGTLATFLTKPKNIHMIIFPYRVAPEDLITTAVKVIFTATVAALLGYAPLSIAAGFLAIIIGTSIDVMLYTAIGYLTFFIGDAEPIQRAYSLIWGWAQDYPVDVFKRTFLFAVFTLIVPLYFITTMPLHIIAGMEEPLAWLAVSMLAAWVVLAKALWTHGLKRWEAYGG